METWFDARLGLYLNVAAPTQAMKEDPSRFEFRVLSPHDVLDGRAALHALLLKDRAKPLKLLVTVSPLPLLATFRDVDVLVANAYSKSVQRAAIEEFVQGREGVDYHPSYEFVTISIPTEAWSRGDRRHVSGDLVRRIMDNVLAAYVDEGGGVALSPEALLPSARMLARFGQREEVAALVARHRDLADRDPEVPMLEATAARRLERLDASFDALGQARAVAPDRPDPLGRMIVLCRPLRQKDRTRALPGEHERAFPGREKFRAKLNWL